MALSQAPVALPPAPKLDVFGVAPGSVTELERCFGVAAREVVTAADGTDQARARQLEEKLEREIQEKGASKR